MSAADPRPPYFLGIDLGGTNIKCGVVDDSGRAISSVSVETNADRGPEEGLTNLAEIGRLAVQQSGLSWDEIKAVGLGTPGTMDITEGILLDPPNLPGWANIPIRRLLSEKLGKPVTYQNDANAAVFGEYWAGAGRGVTSLVLFTLGTGIGGGIIDNGKILEGRHSHGGECGHIIIQMDNARLCSCGQYGHLEAYASATALVKRATEALEDEVSAPLQKAFEEGELSSKTIAIAAERGDPLSVRLMHETARYLAIGAVCLMHTIDPDLVLFSGGMIAAGPSFLEQIRENVKSLAFTVPAKRTKVAFAELGGDAGFIGAAGCARQAFQQRTG